MLIKRAIVGCDHPGCTATTEAEYDREYNEWTFVDDASEWTCEPYGNAEVFCPDHFPGDLRHQYGPRPRPRPPFDTGIAPLIRQAVDRYVEFALRTSPVFRDREGSGSRDWRPGETVTFPVYKYATPFPPGDGA